MSALTFKDLSTELTQAIESELNTPSGTQARCTLGREKVMVLVEYPRESGQAEPLADSTLDWLEQLLRQQFDTVGLPEEAAELSETGGAVAVQLFLKHHSEPKPFTARSFTWKVADGFDDLFGASTDDSGDFNETPPPVFQDSTGSLSFPETDALTDAKPSESAETVGSEEATDVKEAPFLPFSTIENLDSETFSLPGDEPTVDLDSTDLDLPTVDLPIAFAEDSSPSDEGFFDLESGNAASPSTATDSELAADFESALDQSAALLTGDETDVEIAFSEDIFSELLDAELLNSEDLDTENLDTENLDFGDLDSERLDTENFSSEVLASDLAFGYETAEYSPHSDAETLEIPTTQPVGEVSKATVSLKDPFDGNRPIEPSHNEEIESKVDVSESSEGEVEPGEEIFELDVDETEPGEETFESSGEDEIESKVGFDVYGSEDYGSEKYGSEELGDRESNLDEYPTDEDETAEDGESEEERYRLAQASEEDSSYEAVALVDEREVQRQRDQWQQQTKGNPWVFAGAIGFFVVGLLGFVLTRPCSFGACPRIETAQAEGERALSDLTLQADLKAVTAAKQQLNGSVRSLQPIPFWSPHYSEAKAVLPKFEGQLTALDRVSAAQSQAYEAAVASQNPPHSSAKWGEIAQQWRGAIATLENVPADNQVRRLADRKLTEYRANLSTIKVRIDAESQAEASLLAAQKAATLATATAKQASSVETWESALQNWESAVAQIDQIPQGTLAYKEAQGLQAEYRQQMEIVRDRTLQERNASRNLSKAQQLASDAERVASEGQWTVAVQTWTAAVKQIQDVGPGTAAQTVAQPLVGFYQQSLAKADSNRQVSLRFQPVEPSFYAACGATAAQRCTYAVRNGNVRLNLLKDYDRAINQSITPPDQRREVTIDSGVVTQSNQLLKEITLLSTQGNFPIELYNAKGEFLARYRPDLSGFVKDQKAET